MIGLDWLLLVSMCLYVVGISGFALWCIWQTAKRERKP